MGVNGIGKSTVLHALACAFQPDRNGDDHKFPEYFPPNTDATWRDSKFDVEMEIYEQEETKIKRETYEKQKDRWAPRYKKRPMRNVYYIGINTCVPEIEKGKLIVAETYSLILIDEIDLLMHVSSLKKLIERLHSIAEKRHLQIIFTTHSLVVDSMKDYLEFKGRGINYGAATNAFTLAAGMILKKENVENCLIVLDGDCYKSEEERLKQIEKSISGTEVDIEEKRRKALEILLKCSICQIVHHQRNFCILVY